MCKCMHCSKCEQTIARVPRSSKGDSDDTLEGLQDGLGFGSLGPQVDLEAVLVAGLVLADEAEPGARPSEPGSSRGLCTGQDALGVR